MTPIVIGDTLWRCDLPFGIAWIVCEI